MNSTARKYTLIMLNSQGASEETKHTTKTMVRRQIRTWDAKDMTARVYAAAELIYEGSALGF